MEAIDLQDDPPGRLERLREAATPIGIGIIALLVATVLLMVDRLGPWTVLSVTSLLLLGFGVAVLVDHPLIRDAGAIRFVRDGWRSIVRHHRLDGPAEAYPELAGVRVDLPERPNRYVLWLHSRSDARSPGDPPSLRRRLDPQLHRDVERLRDLIRDARLPATMERATTPTHCPVCSYVLLGPDRRGPGEAGASRCPECGWSCGVDGIVLFGRDGPTLTQSMFRRKAGSGRANVQPSGVSGALIAGGALAILVAMGLLVLLGVVRNLSCELITLVLLTYVLSFVVVPAVQEMRSRGTFRERRDDAAMAAAGTVYIELTRDGIVQGSLGGGVHEAESWPKFKNLRVQRWPGGVRVRADRRWQPGALWFARPVDFLADLHAPRRDVKELRRRVYALRDAA